MFKGGPTGRGGSNPNSNNPIPNRNPNPLALSMGELSKSSALAAAAAGSKKRPESASAASLQLKTKAAKQQLDSTNPHLELSDEESEETDLSMSEGDDSSWISWFCSLRGNELLCEIDEDYIQDEFNLCGLQGLVPHYDYALDMILDNDSLSDDADGVEHHDIGSAAHMLYGLIHARYILTSKGLNAMHEKYKRADFGRCPRVFCGGQPCLPVGTSDIPQTGSVKIFCPKCEDIFFPGCKYQTNIDAAFIGTTFPHLYLMTYPLSKPVKAVKQHYVAKVFGFKLHKDPK